MHRESLEHLGRTRSSEKHVRLVFAKEVLESPNTSSHSGPDQVQYRCCGSVVSWLFYWCGVKLKRDSRDRPAHRPSPSAEKYLLFVWVIEAREGPNTSRQSRASHDDGWPTLQGDDGHLSFTWYCWQGGWQDRPTPRGFPTALEEIRCGTLPFESSAVCSSLWAMLTHPGIFSSFGSQRLTEDSVAVDPSVGPLLSDVRMASLVIQCFSARHAYSSCAVLACHR